MRVPSEFGEMLEGQPLDFLYRFWGLMIRTEAIMQQDTSALSAYLLQRGQLTDRRCDLCASEYPLETVSGMAHLALIEIERREREQQTERDD